MPLQARPGIMEIAAYVGGEAAISGADQVLRLASNENPLGPSPRAAEAYRDLAHELHRYPDGGATALRQAIAEIHDLEAARIICGAGSDELIALLTRAYAGPGDEVLYSRHGFLMYAIGAKAVGATPVYAEETNLTANVDALLAKVTEKTKLLFLANPNNPTGTYLPRAELVRLHAALPEDVLLVVDQAYAEYVAPGSDDGALALAAAQENVLVTRTFSKIYGLAGERVGWGTAAPHIVDALNRIRGPFNVTVSAQAAALAALEDQAWVVHSREHNIAERARFAAGIETLGNHGLRAVPSEANFLLVLFEGKLTAQEAHDGLAARGYATRHLPGQGLPNALRITIGTGEQMDEVIAALREMAGEAG